MTQTWIVRHATEADIQGCKQLADGNRDVFGFMTRGAFTDACTRNRLLVGIDSAASLAGFVRYNHRIRGIETALYDICVSETSRRQGLARAMIGHLAAECLEVGRVAITLKCPETLPANEFYAALGFDLAATENGRKRRLNVWRLQVSLSRCS